MIVFCINLLCVVVLAPYTFHMGIFVVSIYLGGSYTEGIEAAWTLTIIFVICAIVGACKATDPIFPAFIVGAATIIAYLVLVVKTAIAYFSSNEAKGLGCFVNDDLQLWPKPVYNETNIPEGYTNVSEEFNWALKITWFC